MPLVEIHRSTRGACEHRAFVLKAVGIGSEIVALDDLYVLFVEAGAAAIARQQLDLYYAENAKLSRAVPVKSREHAWIAPVVYTVLLLAFAFLAGRQAFERDWYAAGALSKAVQDAGEWWRTLTALTLHVDHQHLLSNIGFGALFSFAAARLVGSGVTLASIVAAAFLGNVADVLLMPANHLAIGASTLVFATLGLLSAYSWRIQLSGRLRWSHRWAPLIVGIMLLGFLGSSGENTDVLAHLTGFFFGAAFGVALAFVPSRLFANGIFQTINGSVATFALLGAWIAAFS